MTEIVLPVGTSRVSVKEIPGLIALAIHPRVVAGRVVSYLVKHVPSKKGNSGHGVPLTDAERAELVDIWKDLPAMAPGILESDWPRYTVAFASAKKKPKWTPIPVWRNEALNADILRIDAEEAHRRALGTAISHGELAALNHAGLPMNMAYPDATVTVDALRKYAAKFDVVVRVSAPPISEMTHHLPLFARLKPTTEWKGGRISHIDLLKLVDAAKMASKHAGKEVSIDEFLRAASRGEILLFADCHRTVTMMPCRGSDKPLNIPKQSFPTLPLSACLALSQRGRAEWRTYEDYEEAPAMPKVLCRFTRWQLPDNEPDLESTIDDCRVNGLYTHALADAFIKATAELALSPDAESKGPIEENTTNSAAARTWWDVVGPYMVSKLCASQFSTAKQLNAALLHEAGVNLDSPFDKGTGFHRGSLFIRELSKPLALKTIQNNWNKLRSAAAIA